MLKPKIVLKEKGDSANLNVSSVQATLRWKSSVDLDLHSYYQSKGDAPQKQSFMSKVFGGSGNESSEGRVYFGARGSKTKSPFIYLDQDAGVGDTGGDNEENMYITKLSHLDHVLIVANRYGRSDVFARYDGSVVVKSETDEFEIPLNSAERGSYCIVAHIDNSGPITKLNNVNITIDEKPTLRKFLAGNYS